MEAETKGGTHVQKQRHSLLSSIRILSREPRTLIAKRVSSKYLEKNVSDLKTIWGNDRVLVLRRGKSLRAGGGAGWGVLSRSCCSALPALLPLPLGPLLLSHVAPCSMQPRLSPRVSSSHPMDILGKPFGEDWRAPVGPPLWGFCPGGHTPRFDFSLGFTLVKYLLLICAGDFFFYIKFYSWNTRFV